MAVNVIQHLSKLFKVGKQKQAQETRFKKCIIDNGELVEWFMALVLKTSMGATPSGVRIPHSPFCFGEFGGI